MNESVDTTISENDTPPYDLVIVGAGVSGASQLYAAVKYTNLKRILLVEKEGAPGMVNSRATNNSQTLHEGDIETNYNYEKAKAVQHKAYFTRAYVEKKNDQKLSIKGPKMVFGVGEDEMQFLDDRYEDFKELFPTLEKINGDEIRVREPKMMEGRAETEVVRALYNPDGLTIDYGRLAASLVADAVAAAKEKDDCLVEVRYDTKVGEVTPILDDDDAVRMDIDGELISSTYVSFCAGSHSMYFAKQVGIDAAKEMSLLCIAGNFYHTPKQVNTKVYTVQNPKLPFSAVHADPDILHPDKNRFGPTTRVVFMLERHQYGTVGEYFKTLSPVVGSLFAYVRIMLDAAFAVYALRHNILLLLPFVGNQMYVSEARKIVPTLKYEDLVRAKGQGGVRPQIVRTAEKNPLNLGEAKLKGERMRFNVTPSPGASTCVFNGLSDIRDMMEEMQEGYGWEFDAEKLEEDFGRKLDT